MARISSEQEQRLLDEKDSVELYGVRDLRTRTRTILLSWLTSPPRLITYGLLIYAIIITSLLAWTSVSLWDLRFKPYSPVNPVVQHEVQKVHADTATIFSQEPSPEHNKAWEDLLAPMHMSATKHELEKSNDNPAERLVLVKTVEGGKGQGRWTEGDYLATLGVYHELHCLRRIYWHFYPDVYFVNLTSELMEEERGHARHCIDTIRQSLMCNPNLGLYSFKWRGKDLKPSLETGAQRTCVRWNPVQDWANSRATGWNPLVWQPKNSTSM